MSKDETVYVHHHPDNKPSPMLDKLVECLVAEFRRKKQNGELPESMPAKKTLQKAIKEIESRGEGQGDG